MIKVDNAVIMAAGTSSRFAPLSYELPKALIEVKGEVLIERQIRQLKEAGIRDIYLVVGYKAEMFEYLKEKFGVHLIQNNEYLTKNNHSSIYVARHVLKNSYICSADNYFSSNPFEAEVSECYYAAVYADGLTKEWCLQTDEMGTITKVEIGGQNEWYMLGHVFWDEAFTEKMLQILDQIIDLPETAGLLWESIYMNHLDELKMKIRKYTSDTIFEFDTLDELRDFDDSYVHNTRSMILKRVAAQLQCSESDIVDVLSLRDTTNEAVGFTFLCKGIKYQYNYKNEKCRRM